MTTTERMAAPPTSTEATDPLLRLEGVTKNYGPNTVLRDVSFSIDRGEVVGLLGDNGAGKSTLVKIMSGVVPMSEGSYFWEGEELGRVLQMVRGHTKQWFVAQNRPLDDHRGDRGDDGRSQQRGVQIADDLFQGK